MVDTLQVYRGPVDFQMVNGYFKMIQKKIYSCFREKLDGANLKCSWTSSTVN